MQLALKSTPELMIDVARYKKKKFFFLKILNKKKKKNNKKLRI